jgi:hypothetical protein
MDSCSITSSIGEKKRLVIKNPDGSFMHCYKAGERDSIYLPLEKKKDNKDDIDALTISDTDLEFIVDNYEQFDQGNILEQFVSILQRNIYIFTCLLIIEMLLTFFLIYFTWKKRESSMRLIQKLYPNLNMLHVRKLFYILFGLSIIINIFFYPIGFYSIYEKKFKWLSVFSNISLVTGILNIFVVYINILFLVLFIMRLILYTFARFICNLLISIIVLPKKMQNNDYDTF